MSGSYRHGRARRRRAALAIVPLVVIAIAITPALAGYKSGAYVGTTSQGENAQFSVNKADKTVSVIFFEFNAPPCGGPGGTQYAGLTAKIKKSGKFKALSPGDGFYGYVKGKFNGKKGSGTALYHWDEMGCDSGEVTWTAKKD